MPPAPSSAYPLPEADSETPASAWKKPETLPLLILALAVAAGPQFLHQPLWLSAAVVLTWVLCLAMARGRVAMPGKKTLAVLTWSCFLIILGGSSGSFAQDAGSRLLLIMAALKVLEVKTRRDAMALVFIAHLLVLSSLLYSESLAMALYLAAALILNHGVLGLLHDPEAGIGQKIRNASLLFILAAPLAFTLFIIFPRLASPLWGIQQPSSAAATGFSDHLQPGLVTSLARDRSPAFRVHFEGAVPSSESRYFRGIIFRNATETAWLPDRTHQPAAPAAALSSPWVRYHIILEPHRQPWLFTLDWPMEGTPDSLLTDTGLMHGKEPVRQRTGYTLRATRTSHHLAPPEERDLYLPPESNPRAQALGKSILATGRTDRERLQALTDWFMEKPFHYTLNPGILPEKNAMDVFLFETRKGYCEHYAMGFALLARAAGIPSRIVGGYQGGEVNPVGSYLLVRQSHAHAWTEVFLEKEGWQRFDPTAFIAPDRLEEGGMEASLSEEDRRELAQARDRGRMGIQLRPFLLVWDSATWFWHRQVLSYTHARQQLFFSEAVSWLGDRKQPFFTILALCLLFLFLRCLTKMFLMGWNKEKKEKLPVAWQLFCRRMADAGLPRHPAEGPADYGARICSQRPDLCADTAPLIETYIRLRYGTEHPDRVDVELFLQQIKKRKIPSTRTAERNPFPGRPKTGP
ncbi:DUF3488 and transglutaminase-like domain-containing protein [Desulfobotulus sp. H1]|uniref:DUF3488 and transglutaminase-like domain-containing protein n=1 Tax=Desulfobotulus pelophilus TaxID=2823377 RepID=A0ABT3NAR2_9BACT|nr:DUF3488 and transglutaminase-like domain-containing protein [Desulfobotulus pelophilus]MCW7754261.1 DUF3488 and transglutaminase-like domain-containing protein [Desulfobotulus pelophilus]